MIEHTSTGTTFRADSQRTGRYQGFGPREGTIVRWKVQTDGNVFSSAAVVGELVYFGSRDKHLRAVERATGAEQWRATTGSGISSSPAVAGGSVFIGSEDGFFVRIRPRERLGALAVRG